MCRLKTGRHGSLLHNQMPPEVKTERKRIFVSYRRVQPDEEVARALAETLKRHHHDVFIDVDIRPGSEWGEDIEEALQNTDFLIAILSELATQSPMTVTEVEIAHNRRMRTGEPIIIPIRLRFDGPLRYPLSAYVNRFQYLLWRGPEDTDALINQLIEVFTAQSTKRSPFTQGDRDRLRALQRVRHDWIDGYLRSSFYQVEQFEMVFAEKLDSIEWPLETVVQRPCHEDRLLAPDTRIASVFDEHIGQLLILGAPGSGKTTLLLELAEDLIDRAEKNANLPIPIVLNLSSWSTKRRPLAAWLVDEMNKLYDIPRELAQAWLE